MTEVQMPYAALTDLAAEQIRRLEDYQPRVGSESPVLDVLNTLTGALDARIEAAVAVGEAAQADADEVVDLPGAVPAGTGVTAVERSGGLVRITITLVDTPVVLADNAGVVAYGSLKILDLPVGVILFVGAVAALALTKTSVGVDADWNGDIGLGTVAADNTSTLASTEQHICPTTATPQAVAGVTTGNMVSQSPVVVDGTTTPVDVYLNILVDDADHNVTATACNIVVNGTITIHYALLGDY